MVVTQLSPAYPPDLSGVGDYAALLEKALRNMGLPLVTAVGRANARKYSGYEAQTLTRSSEDLVRALVDTEQVLLHFSGYGYGWRGLCHWLVEGLQRWKAGGRCRRLVTMFHEVYATGPIWRSSYWTAGPQRRIALELARLSDAGFVSSFGGLEQLTRLAPELRLDLLPVFSNVGEPVMPPLLSARGHSAVIFGGAARRQRVFNALSRAGRAFEKRLEALGVTEVVDIGPGVGAPRVMGRCDVRSLGPCPTYEISAVLADARFGLIDYPRHVFTKSGIAAAYFAHRLVTVNTSSMGRYPPGLKEGRHLLGLGGFLTGDFEGQEVADSGHEWYGSHNLAAAAEKFRTSLS